MALQSNYYPVPIVAGTTAGTYAAGDDPRLSDERTPSDDVVTNAKLANVATATIKGRATAGTGDPEDLTASQVRTILNVADGAEVNVQSNWTEADSGSDAFILNKPSIPTASSATPQALGVAAAGTSSDFARADHVHAMPTAADVGAAPSTGIDPTAITGTAVVDSDARLSDSRTPTAHAASHASAGSDPLAPSDIGAQSVFEIISVTASSDTTLTASRAARYNILNFTGTALNITLPTNNIITGDVAIISSPVMTGAGTLVIRRQNADLSYTTLATITKSLSSGSGETFRFYTVGSNTQDWRLDVVPNHGSTHASNGSDPLSLAASQITSGTLAHERGGLEADVSAYNGLLKIASGSTSAVTVTAAGEALLDDADAAAQRTTLGLGNSATLDTGTTAGTVAEGDHTHADLHTRSHAITSTSDHTAGNHKVFYSNGSGEIVELALGNSGEVLTSNGASAAPSFAAASGGGVTGAASSASDVLGVSGSDITGVDATADRIVFWDDSASALKYLEAGSGLSISGTTMTVTATGGATNLWIPASAFIPKTTAGCGVDSRETATNDQNFDELLFDAGSDEFADALVVMPSNYNNGTITARFYWTAASGSGGVAWAIQGRAFANDDALDTAAGTAQLVTDTLIAADDMHVTSATSAVTIGGTPAANTPIQFSIYRDVSDAADDLAVDARLLGVEIIFN